jgi:hypothetical protein
LTSPPALQRERTSRRLFDQQFRPIEGRFNSSVSRSKRPAGDSVSDFYTSHFTLTVTIYFDYNYAGAFGR